MESNIVEGNVLIAKFLEKTGSDNFLAENYKYYHTSWDLLMPVVDKCSIIDTNKGTSIEFKAEIWMFVSNNIEAVWLAVVEFIKWLNKNSNNGK